MSMAAAMSVFIGDLPVGRLEILSAGQSEFRVLESYKAIYPRPPLGQIFLDDLSAVHKSRNRLPPWFSNLLPEGALRELIAKSAGVDVNQEFILLQLLGEDLPGGVRAIASEGGGQAGLFDGEVHSNLPPSSDDEGEWHFSLAGIQLKFSALRHDRGLTIPASGKGGDWIVKLPSPRFEGVPRNEYATMSWAAQSGINVPDVELLDTTLVDGLPKIARNNAHGVAFIVRRFDRKNGVRIHMEDFAQLMNIYPEGKYKYANYETIGRMVLALAGPAGFDEFLRRLVFVVASGNGDMHLKNWSIYYPDGIEPQIAPAYDLVSTIQFFPEDRLALNFGASKDWAAVDLEKF
jgi:serine/threonine-protein kinase HipA